jgi:hypothetical protein
MKYIENKLCTKLVSFTRLYRDAWSKEHKYYPDICLNGLWKAIPNQLVSWLRVKLGTSQMQSKSITSIHICMVGLRNAITLLLGEYKDNERQ